MLNALYVAVWAFLFTGPLSESGQVFGWIKAALYRRLSEKPYLFNPIIGCAKCHAGQIAIWWQIVGFCRYGTFDFPFIITAIFAAYLFEKWLN